MERENTFGVRPVYVDMSVYTIIIYDRYSYAHWMKRKTERIAEEWRKR